MSENEITLNIASAYADKVNPRRKPHPESNGMPVPFVYNPSDDGTDENLLILLHGLGDTEIPFSKLGQQLKLPQTAVLALRAPERVPFLYEDAFQWYTSFDGLGELLDRPDPTPALDVLGKTVAYLRSECRWPAERIHLFGFAQGGTVALEFGVKYERLGSIASVCGRLLSYPTVSKKSETPVLIVHRGESVIGDIKKGYESVRESRMDGTGERMPSSKSEWSPVMEFWSARLGRREMEGVYTIF